MSVHPANERAGERPTARTRSYVQHGAVAVLDISLARDSCCREMTTSDDFGIAFLGFFESRKMRLRNNQHMRRSLRIDIFEREHMRVFMNLLGGNLSANNAAEKTIALESFMVPSF